MFPLKNLARKGLNIFVLEGLRLHGSMACQAL